jgi:hypothetical protein
LGNQDSLGWEAEGFVFCVDQTETTLVFGIFRRRWHPAWGKRADGDAVSTLVAEPLGDLAFMISKLLTGP